MASSLIKAPMIVVKATQTVNNVGANTGGAVTIPISVPSGYTPLMASVEEYSLQNLLECHLESFDGTRVVVRYANYRTSATTMKFQVRVLCR